MDKLDKIVLKIRNSQLSEEDVLKYGRLLIIDFAKDEHQKQLLLCGVSNRRELLLDFLAEVNGNLTTHPHLQMSTRFVDDYLKSNNCG